MLSPRLTHTAISGFSVPHLPPLLAKLKETLNPARCRENRKAKHVNKLSLGNSHTDERDYQITLFVLTTYKGDIPMSDTKRKPDYRAVVNVGTEKKAFWKEVGAGWTNSVDGINVKLFANPHNGDFVLFPNKEKDEDEAE